MSEQQLDRHPWCRDLSRDEAVRAAEDNRPGPLPTLEDVIAEPFANQAKCSPSPSETGETQGRLRTERVTKRRPVDAGGGENVTGLRTERVTLEVTHSVPVAKWDWTNILETYRPGESVRVVEEPERQLSHDQIFAASKKLIDVDQEAALRGFDTTTFQRLWISAIARVLGLELARPPRSKCVNLGDGSIPSPGILASPALVEAHQQIAALTDERDAAICERDAASQRDLW